MNEDQQKALVADFLGRYGLKTTAIVEGSAKTPDFDVSVNGTRKFYCELKSLDDTWLDEQLAKAPPGAIAGGARNDPVFNRVSKSIERACKQFEAINPDCEHPNVLAILNFDDISDEFDLLAVLTGNFYADDGSTHPIYKKFSEGRVKQKKDTIDLYIWIQVTKNNPLFSFFYNTDSQHFEALCDSFNCTPSEIKRVYS
jgi:hypothetical protein